MASRSGSSRGSVLGLTRAKSDLLGEGGALFGVFGGYHRVVGVEAPLLAVLLRRHAIGRSQVPLQHLQLLSVFQADNIVGKYRLADRHERLRFLGRFRRRL